MVVPLKPSEHLSRPLILGVAGKKGREGLIQMLDATCFDKRYFITVWAFLQWIWTLQAWTEEKLNGLPLGVCVDFVVDTHKNYSSYCIHKLVAASIYPK